MRIALLAPAIILAASLAPVPGSGLGAEDEAPSLSEICQTTKCRPPGTFKLNTENGESEIEQPGLPYVYDGQVVVLPGDEFDFEIDFGEGGKPATIALPGDSPRPEHTIHVKFSQMDGKAGMLLSLKNTSAATVKYDAFLVLPDGRGGKTSSCPVRAGLSSFEMWPYPIQQLLLVNFRKLSDPDSMVCE